MEYKVMKAEQGVVEGRGRIKWNKRREERRGGTRRSNIRESSG
jgi:hypothetical protein